VGQACSSFVGLQPFITHSFTSYGGYSVGGGALTKIYNISVYIFINLEPNELQNLVKAIVELAGNGKTR
jgi:hypothetical protein